MAISRMTMPSVVWTLDDALALVRKIQPKIRFYRYHVALGGGVLNFGESRKDLDLYFLPLNNVEPRPNPEALRHFLVGLFGPEYNLGGGPDNDNHTYVAPRDVLSAYPADPVWEEGRYTYRPNGKRIDVFIA